MLEVNKLEYMGLYLMNFPSVCKLLANRSSEVGMSWCTQDAQTDAAEKERRSSLSMYTVEDINFLPIHFYFREFLCS